MHPATLSQVVTNKRKLPLKFGLRVADLICQNEKERSLFIESLYYTKVSIDDIKINNEINQFVIDNSHYKVIAEWEHFAVLELFDLVNFEINPPNIAKKLGVTKERAESVLENLVISGLIIKLENTYQKQHQEIRTTEDISNRALIDAHMETLELGKKKLEQIDLEHREYSSVTIGVDISKLKEAKAIIREFKMKMRELLRDGNKTEVYQLAMQFFPLTKLEQQTKTKKKPGDKHVSI